MGLTQTPIDAIDIPDHNQQLNQGWNDLSRAIKELELYSNMRFASMNDLTTKLVGSLAPVKGMVAWLHDQNSLYVFDGLNWQRVYPSARQTYVGTTVPASTLGAVGDIYYQV
jgi:hypothetical protein